MYFLKENKPNDKVQKTSDSTIKETCTFLYMISPQSAEPNVIASSKDEFLHVLELKSDKNDTLVVSRGNSIAVTKSSTQRLVLSLVSKVFDPIVVVAPFGVGA